MFTMIEQGNTGGRGVRALRKVHKQCGQSARLSVVEPLTREWEALIERERRSSETA